MISDDMKTMANRGVAANLIVANCWPTDNLFKTLFNKRHTIDDSFQYLHYPF